MAKDCTLNLTFSQVKNLAEFFEFEFIDSIRNDTDIENMSYLVDMCDIYKKLQEHIEKEGNVYEGCNRESKR